MKRINDQSTLAGINGGVRLGCMLTLAGCALTFATVPTGLGAGFIMMGGGVLCITGIATECKSSTR